MVRITKLLISTVDRSQSNGYYSFLSLYLYSFCFSRVTTFAILLRSQTKLSIFSQSSAISSLITSGPLQSSSFWSPSPFETVTRHHHHRSSPPSPSDTTIAVRHHHHHRSSPPLPSDTIDLYLSLILF